MLKPSLIVSCVQIWMSIELIDVWGGSSENTWCRKKRWFERETSFLKYDTGMPFPKYDIRMRNKRRLKSWHLMLVLTTSIPSLILVQYCPVIALGSYWMTWPPSFPFLFLLFRKNRVLGPDYPFCYFGAKLSVLLFQCQIARVLNCPILTSVAKLSVFPLGDKSSAFNS